MGVILSRRNALAVDDTANIGSLNQKEIELIKTSWNLIKVKEDFGIGIMVRIFQEHKEIKSKWIFATNLETEAEMISNSQLRYHAKKIIDIIAKVIDKLTSLNSSERLFDDMDLSRLGRNHFHYGVRREHFFYFEDGLMFSLKKCLAGKIGFNQKLEKAWHRLYWIIVNKICDGIEAEEKENLCLNQVAKKE